MDDLSSSNLTAILSTLHVLTHLIQHPSELGIPLIPKKKAEGTKV